MNTCAHCQKLSASAKRCGGCHEAYYCDRTCQTAHWPQHREPCKTTKEIYVAMSAARLAEWAVSSERLANATLAEKLFNALILRRFAGFDGKLVFFVCEEGSTMFKELDSDVNISPCWVANRRYYRLTPEEASNLLRGAYLADCRRHVDETTTNETASVIVFKADDTFELERQPTAAIMQFMTQKIRDYFAALPSKEEVRQQVEASIGDAPLDIGANVKKISEISKAAVATAKTKVEAKRIAAEI